MGVKKLSLIAGGSYLVIFFAAIFANFFVLETVLTNPVEAVSEKGVLISLGIVAFLITVVFDVVVAWALYELYKGNPLSLLSTFFRMMHAAIMGAGVFALPLMLNLVSEREILSQVETFNTLWLIGLFFFGIHLILLAFIMRRPRWIMIMITLAGVAYMIDTVAHFSLPNYTAYAGLFLAMVAIPSIVGEMSLALLLLRRGFQKTN